MWGRRPEHLVRLRLGAERGEHPLAHRELYEVLADRLALRTVHSDYLWGREGAVVSTCMQRVVNQSIRIT